MCAGVWCALVCCTTLLIIAPRVVEERASFDSGRHYFRPTCGCRGWRCRVSSVRRSLKCRVRGEGRFLTSSLWSLTSQAHSAGTEATLTGDPCFWGCRGVGWAAYRGAVGGCATDSRAARSRGAGFHSVLCGANSQLPLTSVRELAFRGRGLSRVVGTPVGGREEVLGTLVGGLST